MRKNAILIISIVFILIIGIISYIYVGNYNKKQEALKQQKIINNTISTIKNNYDVNVTVTKDTDIYVKEKKDYKVIGTVFKNVMLTLEEKEIISEDDTYFNIVGTKYYIDYKNITKSSKKIVDNRYRKYIPFNENIVSTNGTNFYNLNGDLVYSINESFNLPIIMKDNDKYYVSFNDELLYTTKAYIKEIIINNNTSLEPANQVSVLAYHFFYDKENCDQIICLSKSKFEEQIKYLKDNNYLTLKMDELEMFLDGMIRIPKNSVVVTVDDGTIGTNIGIEIIDKYEVNTTLFLVTSWNSPSSYLDFNYLEFHSHSHNLHQNYKCNTGAQGGLLMCIDRDKGIEDLKESRRVLNDTTVFCYPFYEYNSRAIEMLKEAGYKMAFTGGNRQLKIGDDKYKLPRFTILSNTSMDKFISIVS